MIKKMSIQPLGDKVLLSPLLTKEKTKSGIVIPSSAREKQQKGLVLAVGPGTEKEKMIVEVGDVVYYNKYSGDTFQEDGEELLIVKQSEILAKKV